jgi:hypothetical protein
MTPKPSAWFFACSMYRESVTMRNSPFDTTATPSP